MKMNWLLISSIFLILLILFILIIALIGLFNPVKISPSIIASNRDKFRQLCTENPVTCNNSSDCDIQCVESTKGEKMSCIQLDRTEDQIKEFGPAMKVCLPEKTKINCDKSHGGIKVWSGWSNPDRMEWDCLCSYPNYVGTDHCSKINPGICHNGKFDWDISKGVPSAKQCKCNPGFVLIKKPNGFPMCVPDKIKNWYGPLSI